MDKKQIIKEIEKKIKGYGGILFFNNIILLSLTIFTLKDIIGLIILMSVIINFYGLIALLTHVYDIIEERYDEFIEREEYSKKQSLKDKILDFLTIMWFVIPIYILIIITMLPLNLLIAIIIITMLFIIWAIIPYLLCKNKKE